MLSVDMRYNSTFCQYGVLIHVSLCEEGEMLEKNDRVESKNILRETYLSKICKAHFK